MCFNDSIFSKICLFDGRRNISSTSIENALQSINTTRGDISYSFDMTRFCFDELQKNT